MITCSEAVKQLWEYLDGALDKANRDAVEEHLGMCRRCCGEVEFAEELKEFMADHGSDSLPEDVRTRLLAFIEEI
jgi:mycothiol system anti-sigma-R factor